MNGKLHIGRGHSFLAAAGTMRVNSQGVVRNITNSSGHYRPTLVHAQNFPQVLENSGVNIGTSWINIYRFEVGQAGYTINMDPMFRGLIRNMPRHGPLRDTP